MGEGNQQSMYLFKTNPNEIKKLISKLNNKKSSGYDDFSAKFLKLCSPYISAELRHHGTRQKSVQNILCCSV